MLCLSWGGILEADIWFSLARESNLGLDGENGGSRPLAQQGPPVTFPTSQDSQGSVGSNQRCYIRHIQLYK